MEILRKRKREKKLARIKHRPPFLPNISIRRYHIILSRERIQEMRQRVCLLCRMFDSEVLTNRRIHNGNHGRIYGPDVQKHETARVIELLPDWKKGRRGRRHARLVSRCSVLLDEKKNAWSPTGYRVWWWWWWWWYPARAEETRRRRRSSIIALFFFFFLLLLLACLLGSSTCSLLCHLLKVGNTFANAKK